MEVFLTLVGPILAVREAQKGPKRGQKGAQKEISSQCALSMSQCGRLFQGSDNARMDFVMRETEHLLQIHFLQFLLLGSTDVEERGHNVGQCSKEGNSEGKWQDWTQ